MKTHPFADVFPLLSEPELADLAKDIKQNGLRQPIWTFEGQILDGRNRMEACRRVGVKPVFEDFHGSRAQAAEVVWSLNFKRRHLTPSQAAACCVEFDALLATLTAQAKAVQHAQAERGKEGGRGKKKPLPPRGGKGLGKPKAAADKTTAGKLAQHAGVSSRTIERALALKEADPAKLAAVKAGTITLGQAERENKHAAVQQRVALPDAKVRIVYADPPWKYNDKAEAGSVQAGGALRHYPVMSIEKLCALPVRDRCEKDAVLFLWVTSPLLFECAPVIKAWGFTYRASFVWDKVAHNMGHYNSVRHEFLLICGRGDCVPDSKKLIDSVQSIERTAHSEKPEVFREIIDALYTRGKRMELFARRQPPKPWIAWGNEV